MAKISIVYFSETDYTEKLVQVLASEVQSAGHDIFLHRIRGKEIVEGRFVNSAVLDELISCDGIVFASPTYMGGPAAQFKAFADATSEIWSKQLYAGKIAAGITCGGAANGDQNCTLQYFVTLANQHGMLWVGLGSEHVFDKTINPLGCQLGVSALTSGGERGEIEQIYLDTARYLGRRVLKFVTAMKS